MEDMNGVSSSAVFLHRLPSASPKVLMVSTLAMSASRKTLLKMSLTIQMDALYRGTRLENMTSAIFSGTNSSL